MEQNFNALAERIRKGISEGGFCTLTQKDLEPVWDCGNALSDTEKRMHIANFATQYKFIVRMDGELSSVIFQNAN